MSQATDGVRTRLESVGDNLITCLITIRADAVRFHVSLDVVRRMTTRFHRDYLLYDFSYCFTV